MWRRLRSGTGSRPLRAGREVSQGLGARAAAGLPTCNLSWCRVDAHARRTGIHPGLRTLGIPTCRARETKKTTVLQAPDTHCPVDTTVITSLLVVCRRHGAAAVQLERSSRRMAYVTPSTSRATATVIKNALWDSPPAPGSRALDTARVHVRDPSGYLLWSTEASEIGKDVHRPALPPQQSSVECIRDGQQAASLFLEVLAVEATEDNADKARFIGSFK